MKIWRKDSTRPVKLSEPQVQEEELTDISKASTPKKQDSKKDKMEEIYSTKDKQVKYKRQTPLEAEAEAKRAQYIKERLLSGKAEIALDTKAEPVNVVEITSDYEEGTVIAPDIIEDVADFPSKKDVYIQDIDSIDIEIDPSAAVKKYEKQANESKRHDARQKSKSNEITQWKEFSQKLNKVVSKIPVYQHESKVNKIHLKAGRFSDVVEREYDEYLKSNDPTISKKTRNEEKQEHKSTIKNVLGHLKNSKNTAEKAEAITVPEKTSNKKPSNVRKFVRITKRLLTPEKKADKPQETKSASDYQSRQEAKFVAKEISQNLKKLALKTLWFFEFFVLSIILTLTTNAFHTDSSPIIYSSINLLILVLIGVFAKPFILSGLRPLKHFRGNSDTAISCAYIATLLQGISALVFPIAFTIADMHMYTAVVAFGFMLNTAGRVLMVSRVRWNFRFITLKNPSYAAKILCDDEMSRKMLSGTIAQGSLIAYQHPTDFLSDFLKISYAPDKSEDSLGKLAPITLICSIFVSVIYGITFKSIIGAVSALSIMCCISVPVCILLAGNIPMLLFCKKSIDNNAMLCGYPTVKQFCDTDAVIARAKDLYPKQSVKVVDVKQFTQSKFEDTLISTAAILKELRHPMKNIFDKMIEETQSTLPKVESALYEEKSGIVGWVNSERILIGNRKLMDRYHIYLPDNADETKYLEDKLNVTYIACSGQLVAMFVTEYKPDEKVMKALHSAHNAGLCIAINSNDYYITAEKIAEDYHLFERSIKVLSTGYSNTCTELTQKKEETSRAYLATRGKFYSLLHAVAGSVVLKNNLTLGVVIQIFGLLLGVLLCATMILYASVSILNIFEILLYMISWGAATILSQFIKRK